MTNEEIRKATHQFVIDIMNCHSVYEARKIERRISEFYKGNDVPEECDELLQSGMCESLSMMCAHNNPYYPE